MFAENPIFKRTNDAKAALIKINSEHSPREYVHQRKKNKFNAYL